MVEKEPGAGPAAPLWRFCRFTSKWPHRSWPICPDMSGLTSKFKGAGNILGYAIPPRVQLHLLLMSHKQSHTPTLSS